MLKPLVECGAVNREGYHEGHLRFRSSIGDLRSSYDRFSGVLNSCRQHATYDFLSLI
jgi:hypothetical protein